MTAKFRIESLATIHDRTTFHSESEALDRYFTQQVTQDVRRRVTACFVALANEEGLVAGYYTLAASSVVLTSLPDATTKKLPRYPSVPTVRLGRLAVDQRFTGQGLGAALLADALTRSSSAEIAAFALVVDAKDEGASAFYRHHGFIPLLQNPLTLFLPLSTAAPLIRRNTARPTGA